MWYRTAITTVNPVGQISMDFPGIKPKKFDVENDVKFELHQEGRNTYQISALLGDGRSLGYISFYIVPEDDTAKIEMVSLREYPTAKVEWEESANPTDRFKSDIIKELKDAGYSVDESSVSRLKWGIGKKLYEEALKFIQNNYPDVQYITGYVHSKDAYQSRNSVFGLPIHAYDPDQSSSYEITGYTPQEEAEEISNKISNDLMPSSFDATGYSHIPPSVYYVQHKIPQKLKEESTPGGLIDVV